jgi:hypothetical protein
VKAGQSLEDAAREAELTLERTDWVQRRPDGFIEGIGASQELMATAFVLEAGTSSDRIFEMGDKLALVHVAERQAADEAAIAEEIELEKGRLRQQKINQLSDTWIRSRRDRLVESGQLQINVDLGRPS